MPESSIEIADHDLHWIHLRTRLPFRYGIATMTTVSQLFVQLRVVAAGKEVIGISSDCLPPKWFTKVAGTGLDEEVSEMLRVIRHALKVSMGLRGESAFDLWQQVYAAQSDWATMEGVPPLLCHFGTSLVERALIEAVCRASHRTFAEMLHDNLFGVRLEQIHGSLAGRWPSDFLPVAPLQRLIARHTVGLADPLTEEEIGPEERLDDGLPQSLAACIARYGLRHFKIKVNGDIAQDLERLSRIAPIVQEQAWPEFAFSLDGNEQFKSLEEFREFWEAIRGRAKLREFFRHLLFVEQPLHRDLALKPEVGVALQQWPDRPPLIIDESDATLQDLSTALQLGYAGTSHKNCKGVFKGIAHRCLLSDVRAGRRGPGLMSGEDLCNIGPVALLQDLTVMGALGIGSVERNGHHYHAGLSQFPKPLQEQVLAHHGDLYERSHAGWPAVRITEGEIELSSLNRAPFGVGFLLEVGQLKSVEPI